MKNKVELPLVEPMYSTYHYQGPGSAIIAINPSIRNWYLNQVLILECSRNFLNGGASPGIKVSYSQFMFNPHIERFRCSMRFLKGYIHYVIKNMLDEGYYVHFEGIDDYYVEGKGFYHEKHFYHDGCICGYNGEDKTYCIYAYDKDWIYRKFWVKQKSFEAGRKSMFKQKFFGTIYGIKPKSNQVIFSAKTALKKIEEYLDSNMEKYPETEEGDVFGIVVHNYIAKYVEKLYDGSIPYEKIDRRVFRLIWEHKNVMLERIQCIEKELSIDSDISNQYEKVVANSNTIRMLYASHIMKRRDSVLPIIKNKLLIIKELEEKLLNELLEKAKVEETI